MPRSVRLRPRITARAEGGDVPAAAPVTSAPRDRPTVELEADGGALRRASLRFRNDQVERLYQRQAGAESLTGFRIATGTASVMWLLAAIVVPTGTPIPADRAVPVCLAMAVFNSAGFLLSGQGGHAGPAARDHLRPDRRERAGHPLACVCGRRPAGIRDQRDHAALLLRVRRAHRLHLRVVPHGRHRRRFRRRCRPLCRPEQPPRRHVHLRSRRDRWPRGAATPRAVTSSRLLSGHRHHPAGRRIAAREGPGRRAVAQRPSGIDLVAPPRRRGDDRRCVSGRHRALCRHRRVHVVDRASAGRRSGRDARPTLRPLRRARGRTRTREDQDHR